MNKTWTRVWITGASEGIGAAVADHLAESGVEVHISARSADRLIGLAAGRANLVPQPLDVTDPEACAACVARIEADHGPIDLAILGAGIYTPIPGGIADPRLFADHMNVNYLGVVNCAMPLLRKMKECGRGQVAILGSVAGYRGLPRAAAYGPTKAALIHLAEVLALDLRGTGVQVQLINPGFVATRLTDKNDFRMPALLSPDQAAEQVVRGLGRGSFEVAFPWRFVAWLKAARLLPYRWYFPLMSKATGG